MDMVQPKEFLGTDEDVEAGPTAARWSEEKVDNFQEIFTSITTPVTNLFDTIFQSSATRSQQELDYQLRLEKLRAGAGDSSVFKLPQTNSIESWILPAAIVGGIILLARKK